MPISSYWNYITESQHFFWKKNQNYKKHSTLDRFVFIQNYDILSKSKAEMTNWCVEKKWGRKTFAFIDTYMHSYWFILSLTFVSFLVIVEFSSGSDKFTEFFATFLAVHPCVLPFI